MKALVFDGTLRFDPNHPDPQPGSGEVLVKVIQAGICATDLEIVKGYMDFCGVPGHEFVGTVVEGSAPLAGRRVVGEINCPCRRCDMCSRSLPNHCRNRTVLGIAGRDGAFAEYLSLPADNLHVLPDRVSDDQAVFIEPLAAAFQVTRQHAFSGNEKVAVLGPGRLGLLVAQVLAPRVGELHLFGRSLSKQDLARQLGLQIQRIDEATPRQVFDVAVDCTGHPEGLAVAQDLVRPRGTVILKSTFAGNIGPNLALTVINEITIIGSRCGPFAPAIEALEEGCVRVEPMISRRFAIQDGVEAFTLAQRPGSIKVLLEMERT
ncbi:MAG: alcohol dehydrogenase catalytic domain-containing protein [Phycisphaerae bacterium]|nr:alcohol dehydrogenase catalytic domain-containing protein [Phycisphaerae bacterium]